MGGVGEQGRKLFLEIVLLVCLPDEVQHGQAFLVFSQTQAAAQLLQKHGQRLGGAQEQHGVDFRDVHAFVVNVHHKNETNPPGNEPLFGGVALLIGRIAGQRYGRDAVGVKIVRHEPGVLDGNAEAKPLYLVNIGDIFQDRIHHKVSAALCYHAAEGVQVGQFGLIITAGAPFQTAQVGRIGHAEILERAQQFPVNGFRQANLGGNAPTEIIQNALAVHTLRCGSQAQQNLWLIILQQLLIGGRGGMVEFVHHDIIVEISPGLGGKILRVEGLDGNKQVFNAVHFVIADQQFAEIGIFQHGTESVQALFQDFFPMRHEQQAARLSGMLFAEALVIQCGDHSFAGAGGGDYQVAVVTPNGALGIQSVQNFLLVGIGQNIQGIDPAVVGLAVFFGFQGADQPFPLPFIVIFKLAGVPVAFKGGCDLFDGLRQVLSGHLDVPFQTAGNCRIGQVGGAYIRRSKTGVPVKYIGLCVQAGTFGVVTDLDLRIGQRAQLLDGFYVRSAHIRGGDDAQFAAALCKLPQLVHDEA